MKKTSFETTLTAVRELLMNYKPEWVLREDCDSDEEYKTLHEIDLDYDADIKLVLDLVESILPIEQSNPF